MSEEIPDDLGLSLALDEVDTTRRVLVPNKYVMEVESVERKPNKAQTGHNLLVVFKTISDTTSSKAEMAGEVNDIKPGYKVRKYYPLQKSDNPDAPDFREDLARLQDALENTSKGNRPTFYPAAAKGKLVVVTLGVESNDQYGDGNVVKALAYYDPENAQS